MNEKIEYFKYFCIKLVERYDLLGLSDKYKEDFGRLGVMKMLFFAVVSMNQAGNNELIDRGIFNNFWALPNGPVESECYNWICTYMGPNFESNLVTKTLSVDTLGNNYVYLETAINAIPSILFTKNTFELVEISHRYKSWLNAYKLAIENSKRSSKMDIGTLKTEDIFLAIL